MSKENPTNEAIADHLEQIADLLEVQDANPFRVRAYRNGADTIREMERPVAGIAAGERIEALDELPNIGEGLARVIDEFVRTGRSAVLDELEGEVTPGTLFTQVPGIGEELAGRVVEHLDIRTLEELERAAHDGRLDSVPGFGSQRVKAVQMGLAGMLQRYRGRREEQTSQEPPVSLLLDVDATYRQRAEAGELETIAPRRFNPSGEAWLPILHAKRGGWSFTVLYSNTARAHDLDKTRDWVVIYYRPEEDGPEQQVTVVTGTSGTLEGKRVIRGREAESRRHYQTQ